MRRLLYVPIIHSEADLGSAGATLAQKTRALLGERRWAIHQRTVEEFWESVGAHLLSLGSRNLAIYQDGLAADSEVGRRIVDQAAAMGSRNYQLVQELLNRGSELRKTEDPLLLWRQRASVLAVAHQGSAGERPGEAQHGQDQNDLLLVERDSFIASTISGTLKEGELGVLFIGAYHDVASRLAADISVETVKKRETVNAYFQELMQGRDDRRFSELAQYLSSPVADSNR